MTKRTVEQYLAEVEGQLKRLSPTQRAEELDEIRQHLDEMIAEHQRQGRSEAEATQLALTQFGRAVEFGKSLAQATPTPSSAGRFALMYVVSVLIILGFFITANDKPTDFPYTLPSQILLALVIPAGMLVQAVWHVWQRRRVIN